MRHFRPGIVCAVFASPLAVIVALSFSLFSAELLFADGNSAPSSAKRDAKSKELVQAAIKTELEGPSDKRAAFREILQMCDPKRFVAKSGWYPGVPLQGAILE